MGVCATLRYAPDSYCRIDRTVIVNNISCRCEPPARYSCSTATQSKMSRGQSHQFSSEDIAANRLIGSGDRGNARAICPCWRNADSQHGPAVARLVRRGPALDDAAEAARLARGHASGHTGPLVLDLGPRDFSGPPRHGVSLLPSLVARPCLRTNAASFRCRRRTLHFIPVYGPLDSRRAVLVAIAGAATRPGPRGSIERCTVSCCSLPSTAWSYSKPD